MSTAQIVEQIPAIISLSRNSSYARSHIASAPTDSALNPKAAAVSTRRATSTSSQHHLPNDSGRTEVIARSSSSGSSPHNVTVQPFDGISEPVASGSTVGPLSLAMRRKEQLYFIAMCFPLFVGGWNELRTCALSHPRLSDPILTFELILQQCQHWTSDSTNARTLRCILFHHVPLSFQACFMMVVFSLDWIYGGIHVVREQLCGPCLMLW